jgi:hypothetical protein
MDKIIYVVRGSTGEYSDRWEWLVKAFTDKITAENFVNDCSAIARREFDNANKSSSFWGYEKSSELDPNFSMDYTGTNYYLEEVELQDG